MMVIHSQKYSSDVDQSRLIPSKVKQACYTGVCNAGEALGKFSLEFTFIKAMKGTADLTQSWP